jgi:plasmid stabilization system protein ParE
LYHLDYLPSAVVDILVAEDYLNEFSPSAADKFTEAIEIQTNNLRKHPLMYPVYRYDESLRCITLPYEYLYFYYVDESAKLIQAYRILRGMQDIENLI